MYKLNLLKVIARKGSVVVCECVCGKEILTDESVLRGAGIVSCGCTETTSIRGLFTGTRSREEHTFLSLRKMAGGVNRLGWKTKDDMIKDLGVLPKMGYIARIDRTRGFASDNTEYRITVNPTEEDKKVIKVGKYTYTPIVASTIPALRWILKFREKGIRTGLKDVDYLIEEGIGW